MTTRESWISRTQIIAQIQGDIIDNMIYAVCVPLYLFAGAIALIVCGLTGMIGEGILIKVLLTAFGLLILAAAEFARRTAMKDVRQLMQKLTAP